MDTDWNTWASSCSTDTVSWSVSRFSLFLRLTNPVNNECTGLQINYQTLENYLMALEVGYNKHNNPYHNPVHAGLIIHAIHWHGRYLNKNKYRFQPMSLKHRTGCFHRPVLRYSNKSHNSFFLEKDKNLFRVDWVIWKWWLWFWGLWSTTTSIRGIPIVSELS